MFLEELEIYKFVKYKWVFVFWIMKLENYKWLKSKKINGFLKKRKKFRGKKWFNGKINELEKCYKLNINYRFNILVLLI